MKDAEKRFKLIAWIFKQWLLNVFNLFIFRDFFFLLWHFVLINQIEGAFDGELKNMGFYKMVEKTTRQTIKWLV